MTDAGNLPIITSDELRNCRNLYGELPYPVAAAVSRSPTWA